MALRLWRSGWSGGYQVGLRPPIQPIDMGWVLCCCRAWSRPAQLGKFRRPDRTGTPDSRDRWSNIRWSWWCRRRLTRCRCWYKSSLGIFPAGACTSSQQYKRRWTSRCNHPAPFVVSSMSHSPPSVQVIVIVPHRTYCEYGQRGRPCLVFGHGRPLCLSLLLIKRKWYIFLFWIFN